jgi:hypothetical protein
MRAWTMRTLVDREGEGLLTVRCLPTALALPLKKQDFGTSRWQLG